MYYRIQNNRRIKTKTMKNGVLQAMKSSPYFRKKKMFMVKIEISTNNKGFGLISRFLEIYSRSETNFNWLLNIYFRIVISILC